MTPTSAFATQAPDLTSTYTAIGLSIVTVTPLHQGAFNDTYSTSRNVARYKNFSAIRTVTFYHGSTGYVEVPAISGNSLRGRLRRYTAQALFQGIRQYAPESEGAQLVAHLLQPNQKLTNKEQQLLKLFYAGGTLGTKKNKKQPKDDPRQVWALKEPFDRPAIEALFPMLPLFGYTNGDTKMRPGSINVTDLFILTSETLSVLEQWDVAAPFIPNEVLPSWQAAIHQNPGGAVLWPRMGSVRTNPMSLRHREASEDEEAETETDTDQANTQMIVMNEYVPSGFRFLGGLYLHESTSLIERGLLYTALDALIDDQFLGGKRSQGYGLVHWDAPAIADKADAVAAWQDHLHQNAAAMSQALLDLFEFRASGAKGR